MFVYYYNALSIPFYRLIFQNKKTFYKVVCLQFFLILALRDGKMGADNGMYFRVFEAAGKSQLSEIISKFSLIHQIELDAGGWGTGAESAYMLCNWIFASLLGLPFQAWIIALAFFNTFVMYKFLVRHAESPLLGAMVFGASTFWDWFYILKRTTAMSVLLLTFMELEDKHYFRAFLLGILSILFHRTSLVILVLFPLAWFTFSRKTFRIVMSLSVVFSVAGLYALRIFLRYFALIAGRGTSMIGTGFHMDHQTMACLFLMCMFYLLVSFKKMQTPDNNFLGMIFMFVAATSLINSYVNVVGAMSFVFQPLMLIFATNVLYRYRYRTKYLKYIVFTLIFMLMYAYCFNKALIIERLVTDPSAKKIYKTAIYTIYPYRTFWD